MDLLLGIDLGTSYFKLALFDRSLVLRGLGRIAVPTREDGDRRELDPEAFWQTLRTGLAQALAAAGAQAADIRGLSWSSQANSFLLLDADQTPLTPLILWTDRRGTTLPGPIRQLAERPDYVAVTGIGTGTGPNTAFAKLLWFQAEEPGVWTRADRFLTISDYLAFSLTGTFQGDAGTASLLGGMDQQTLAWWPEALRAVNLDASRLSTPLRPGTRLGRVTAAGAARLGLPAGIPVAAGSLDHHAASLGAGLGNGADVSESTGTVLACIGLTDTYRPRAGICFLPGLRPGTYAMLAFDNNGAGVLEWYQRTFAPNLTFRELDQLAESVPADCDGLVARPLPHLQPGLTGFDHRRDAHGPGHYARAIMTATTDKLGELLDRLSPERRPGAAVATGGGAHSPFWLNLKRERLGINIFPAACPEPACRGAALLAARVAPDT